MNVFRILPITILTALLFTACSDDGEDRLAEKAQIEGQAQAKEQLKKDRELLEEQIQKQKELQEQQLASERRLQQELQETQVQNERKLQNEQIAKERKAVDSRAKIMEKSLTKLQEFYEDNSGVYEGTMTRGSDQFSVRISLYPNIPRYSDSRIRTPAEIETDLTTLAYSAQILQWMPPGKESVGCRINGLKPNTKKGTLQIISPDCPSTYSLVLNRTTITGSAQSENHPDVFDIYASRIAQKSAPKPVSRSTVGRK